MDIRYTLDGTIRQRERTLYTEPIAIHESATLVANAYKRMVRKPRRRLFLLSRDLRPIPFPFITKPDPKYSAETPALLTDGTLGDYANLSNGEWVGYQKNEAAYYLFFNNKITPECIIANAAKYRRDIFPPQEEVWGGMDEGHMQLL